jgi:hypothetical protein
MVTAYCTSIEDNDRLPAFDTWYRFHEMEEGLDDFLWECEEQDDLDFQNGLLTQDQRIVYMMQYADIREKYNIIEGGCGEHDPEEDL